MAKRLRIALDVFGTSFMEDYRIKAYRGVIRYARQNTDWEIFVNDQSFSLAHQFITYEDLRGLRIDGLIFADQKHHTGAQVARLNIPAVNINGYRGSPRISGVSSDDPEVGRMGARHFIERGFRSLAFCGPGNWNWCRQRAEAFAGEARRQGRTCSLFLPDYPADDDYEYEDDANPRQHWTTPADLRGWIASLEKPVGIMGCHDQRALHALEACKDMNFQIPNEVSVLGVDNNLLLCEASEPSLSSIDLDPIRIGYESARILDRMISRRIRKPCRGIVSPKGIVTRMSSDILAVEDTVLARALQFIQNRKTQNIGVDHVVEAAGVSRRTLERRFKERIGRTINREICHQRIELAKMLLFDTHFSIDAIAMQCGFRYATYFSQIFEKEIGVSPGKWRLQNKGIARIERLD